MIALDTNVLVYRLDAADRVKQARASDLVDEIVQSDEPSVLMWQVCGEYMQQLRRRQVSLGLDEPTLRSYVTALIDLFALELPTANVPMRALDLAIRHTLSHWDSMLVAACIEAGVDKLYTEDMGAPRQIESVALINPFAVP